MPSDRGHRLDVPGAIRRLRKQGWTLAAIGSLFGVSRQAIHIVLSSSKSGRRKARPKDSHGLQDK